MPDLSSALHLAASEVTLAVGALVLLCLFYFWAVSSGNWTSRIPPDMIRQYHSNILQMEHP